MWVIRKSPVVLWLLEAADQQQERNIRKMTKIGGGTGSHCCLAGLLTDTPFELPPTKERAGHECSMLSEKLPLAPDPPPAHHPQLRCPPFDEALAESCHLWTDL